MKTVSTFLLILAAAVAPAFAVAPAWDSSGNGQLSGTYYFRQVIYVADSTASTSQALAYYGNIVFSGTSTGTYTITSAALLNSSSGSQLYSASGTYSVSASGYGVMTSPIISGTSVYFLVSNHILIGADTESGYNDLFIATPFSSSLTNASLSGAYTINGFFPGGTPSAAADVTYQLNSDGAGHLNTVSLSGYTGAGTTVTQSSSGVRYAFSNGAAVVTFPTSTTAPFYSGNEYMYLSPDGNFVFGGSPGGFDFFVGVRNATGSSASLSGLYYEAGLDENSSPILDSYYGTFNASQGNVIGHERLLYAGYAAQGFTYYTSYPTSSTSTYQDPSGSTQYTIGQGGIRVAFGIGPYLSMGVALPYTPPAATGSVYLDPTGIVNSASSAPYTAGIAPGEFLTLYNGVNLASTTIVESGAPYPTCLGGVQPTCSDGVKVLIDGLAAPLYYVSPTQISLIVPYAVTAYATASIQVSNHGVLSNVVTTYVHQTSPGVFTANPVGGYGVAAMLDFPASGATYYIVSASQPAQPGDTIALYLTGLGTPFPGNGDGALGPATGDSLVNGVTVDVGGVVTATPGYAGLAPALAGLYQINFVVPPLCATATSTGCLTKAGTYTLGITGQVASGTTLLTDSYSDESVIPVGSGVTSSVRASSEPVPAARKTLPRLSAPAGR